MHNAIHSLIIYLDSDGSNISLIYSCKIQLYRILISEGGSQFVFLKRERLIQDLESNSRPKQIHLF